MLKTAFLALLCITAVLGQDAEAPSTSETTEVAEGPVTETAEGPVTFAATGDVASASAPNPSGFVRERTGNYALDSLASTPTSYHQIQTLGTYSSAHISPIPEIVEYLGSAVGDVDGLVEANAPNSTQFTQLEIYNQLEDFGARAFHFPIYYDPTGKTYQEHAGLKIVNQSANTSEADVKWTYPGWKIMDEPDFDFNTTCTTLVTCLFNIKNWILSTPGSVPITIFLEPTGYTYTGDGSNTTFADALAASTEEGGPDSLAAPIDIVSFEPFFQPWRDLENEVLGIFDENAYFTIVTPDDLMDDEDNLAQAVLKEEEDYTLYPALTDLQNRIFVVLTGDYVQNYLEYYPDLKNATFFVSEPYNADMNYTTSTLFVDVLGSLPGTNGTSFNTTAAREGSKTLASQITEAVEAGYMVRASADWDTVEARENFSLRSSDVIQAGAHFVQTTFPTTPTIFNSTYSIALPVRGNQKQSTRCNPLTTGGVFFNATEIYTVGCPALDNAPASAPAASSE